VLFSFLFSILGQLLRGLPQEPMSTEPSGNLCGQWYGSRCSIGQPVEEIKIAIRSNPALRRGRIFIDSALVLAAAGDSSPPPGFRVLISNN
jgi:hypothetical protein